MKKLLIWLALVAGCRSFDVRAFDVPISPQPRRMAAAADDAEIGPLAVALVAAACVGFGVLYYNYGSS